MVGIFLRRDHPKGYGMPEGTAHGYVTIFVKAGSKKQLKKVEEILLHRFYGTNPQVMGAYSKEHLGDWYGGGFDLVGIMAGNKHSIQIGNGQPWAIDKEYFPFGDTRCAIIYDAQEIIECGKQ